MSRSLIQVTGRDNLFFIDANGRNWELHTDFVRTYRLGSEPSKSQKLNLLTLDAGIQLLPKRRVSKLTRSSMGPKRSILAFR